MRQLILVLFLIVFFEVHSQSYTAKIITNFGDIDIILYDSTPKHRDNFIKLVQEKFYDSLLFHRVIPDFVAQGGDPDSKNCSDTFTLGDGDLGYTIPAEFRPEYFHKRGALGQARDDNPEMASSACQFYIVQGKIANDSTFFKAHKRNNYVQPVKNKIAYRTIGGIPHLDMRYTIYGEVIKGMEAIDKITAVKRNDKDRPLEPVRIKTITLKQKW